MDSESTKKVVRTGLVTLTCVGVLNLCRIATAATATLPILARLVRAIEVTVNTSLNFGTLAMTTGEAGLVRLDPAANALVFDRTRSSLSSAGGVPQAGRLQIRGAAFPIAVSIESSVVNLSNGITTVSVTDFNILTANGGSRITITPTAGNTTFTVPVGATLHTQPNQLTGTYVGTTRIFTNFQ